jgi:hypothetical protein
MGIFAPALTAVVNPAPTETTLFNLCSIILNPVAAEVAPRPVISPAAPFSQSTLNTPTA